MWISSPPQFMTSRKNLLSQFFQLKLALEYLSTLSRAAIKVCEQIIFSLFERLAIRQHIGRSLSVFFLVQASLEGKIENWKIIARNVHQWTLDDWRQLQVNLMQLDLSEARKKFAVVENVRGLLKAKNCSVEIAWKLSRSLLIKLLIIKLSFGGNEIFRLSWWWNFW